MSMLLRMVMSLIKLTQTKKMTQQKTKTETMKKAKNSSIARPSFKTPI